MAEDSPGTPEHNYLKTIQKGSYAELSEEQRRETTWGPGRCEATGGHVVNRPAIWPPRLPSQGKKGKTYGSGICQRCGATVILHDPLSGCVRFADEPTPPKAA